MKAGLVAFGSLDLGRARRRAERKTRCPAGKVEEPTPNGTQPGIAVTPNLPRQPAPPPRVGRASTGRRTGIDSKSGVCTRSSPASRRSKDWRGVFDAIDAGNWAAAQAGIADLPRGVLTPVAKAELYTAKGSPVVDLASIQSLIAEAPSFPRPTSSP